MKEPAKNDIEAIQAQGRMIRLGQSPIIHTIVVPEDTDEYINSLGERIKDAGAKYRKAIEECSKSYRQLSQSMLACQIAMAKARVHLKKLEKKERRKNVEGKRI